MDYVSYYFS